MAKKTASLWSLGEPLFLGLSCVVGGEQFYLLLYGTGRSIRGQSFVLVITAIITCIMSAAVSSRTDILAHLFHLFYMSVLLLLIAISNEITSRAIVTTSIIALGYGMTVLVIQSCSLYSTSREELLSFILGMFIARYLPCFFRLFISKGCSCDSEIGKLSIALGISRLVFCIISLVLKVIMGRFELSIIVSFKFKNIQESSGNPGQSQATNGQINVFQGIWWSNLWTDTEKSSSEITDIPEKSLKQGFEQIRDHRKYIYSKSAFDDHLEDYDEDHEFFDYIVAKLIFFSKQFSKPMPIVLFLTSVFIFLMYPKTSFSAYCSYSPKVISTIMNVKFTSHIIGSLVGIGYPASVTSNSPLFATITFFFYFLFTLYFFLPYSDKYFKKNFVYSKVGVSSFVLGYLWSYNLGLIINMVLKETCIYEEVETFEIEEQSHNLKIGMKKKCCGEKITSKCYCKLGEIFDFLDVKYEGRTFVCSTLFVRDDGKLSDRYSPSGKCAIILMYNTDDWDPEKTCSVCCQGVCKGKCCLKIIGIYKLEAVTVSSCEDCQLTVRLEGTCCDPKQCPPSSGKGGSCTCNGSGNSCCCICVKCCNNSPPGCCCIHYCKKGGSCQCSSNLKPNEVKDARLFICYKTNDEKCCIKEIRPNDKGDFAGDLKVKTQFDISDIFISNCCHVDVRVDLKCTVKNNYFRLGGANYPNKFEKPDIVRLFWSEGVCCPTARGTQCCCMFSRLVRGCIVFKGEEVKCGIIKKSKNGCSCPGSDQKCCITPSDLIVDEGGGFVKRVDRIRVKLVVISWLFFGLVFFFVVLISSMFRSKYIPQTFYPMTSYSKLAGTFEKNKYNTDEQVTARIVGLLVNGKMSDQTVEAKKVEMKAMLSMFAKYTKSQETKKTKEVEKIHKYITSKATSFSPSSSIGGRACELCVVEWSQCVGLVYKYAMALFYFVQKFFISWEEAWEIEVYNYEKQILPYVTKVTHNSRTSLSAVMSEVNVGDKSNEEGLNRLMTWNGTFKETKQLSQVKMKEDNMINESLPPKVGNRLCYYVRSWNHRLDNIRNWCQFDSNIFDWVIFLNEYYKIREWVTDVSPGLRCDSEVKVSTKDLNKGIKIFISTM